MAQDQEQLDAEINRITYRNDENGWTVAKVKVEGQKGLVTTTGQFAKINEGQMFQLFGTWTSHPHYGDQFKIERAVPVRPTSKGAIIRYLGSGIIHGIGPKTAEKIVDHFGVETLDILDHDIKKLLEVQSIGRKKLEAIISSWSADKATNDVMVFLSTHGISSLYAQKILKLYGSEAIKIVSKDPYRLALEIHGIGFRSADAIAQSLGIAADSQERITAGVLFQLKQAEDSGHCFQTTEQMTTALCKTLELEEPDLTPILVDCLNILNDKGAIFSDNIFDDYGGQTSAHYRAQTMVAEINISRKVGELLQHTLEVDMERVTEWIEKYSEASNTILSADQTESLYGAARNRVFILTGGPGVGKTTTANAIIQLFKAMSKSVALCAPTGRAAQRLTEVSSTQARTIHRLLEWAPHVAGFQFDENNPLAADVVVVDEASMLDVNLADALLRAVKPTAQVIFIGDIDQLPSVGPGNVLRDMIESKEVPFKRLSQIFRQAETSKIIQASHAINRGEAPEFDIKSDCKFIEVENPENIKGVIRALINDKIPKETAFDPVNDIQILTPMNRGSLGTQVLNEEIQELLNPKSPGKEECTRGAVTLRPKDKVIQTVNNYDLAVFNGDIGIVQQCNVDGGKLIVQFGDRVVIYSNEQILELRLAYAITIHKSQGSEFPVVILPISMQHFIMLQRNLMYTGLTRAKKLAIFVGTSKALIHSIRNQTAHERQTMLVDRIKKEFE